MCGRLYFHTRWLVIILVYAGLSGCQGVASTPVTPVEVTRLIPVTQLMAPTVVEVTRIVEVVVVETVIVEVLPTPITSPVSPAMTESPAIPEPTAAVPDQLAPSPSPLPTLPNPELLAWYSFENNFLSSGVVRDLSGNGYDANIIGTVGSTQGISDSQALFLPGGGYIQAQGNPAAGRNTVSFSLWFRTDNPEANYKLASAAWWNGGPGSGWVLATHVPEFWSEDSRSLFLPDLINYENYFPVDKWVHEVVTYDGTRIKEYTNGILVNDWASTGLPLGQGQAMVVGAWPSTGFYFQGSLDEFQVFSWSLSPIEVQDLYDRGR